MKCVEFLSKVNSTMKYRIDIFIKFVLWSFVSSFKCDIILIKRY